jgi:GNAT superfamily N-acetyltransferase
MVIGKHSIASRFDALTRGPADTHDIASGQGAMSDYHALSSFHYRAARPATVTRVLALRHRWPSAADRFAGRADRWRTIAVLVESMPTLHGRMREQALGQRYGAWPAGPRAALLKAELRCISRVIVHPQWRGLGLAVRLVREALQSAETPLTEAYAAMGKVNPFFEKAGMTAYPSPPRADDARLLSALNAAGFDRTSLALIDTPDIGLRQRIDALPEAQAAWLHHEVKRWYRQTFGRTGQRHDTLTNALRAAQQRLSLEPVYYLHDNRPPAATRA